MKLTVQDKQLLLSWGHPETDFEQIEEAMKIKNTSYELFDDSSNTKITRKEAIAILGREVYLNGLARSSFHWSSVRDGKNNKRVHFDSSNLFKF